MEGRTSEKPHRNLHCTKGVVKKEPRKYRVSAEAKKQTEERRQSKRLRREEKAGSVTGP